MDSRVLSRVSPTLIYLDIAITGGNCTYNPSRHFTLDDKYVIHRFMLYFSTGSTFLFLQKPLQLSTIAAIIVRSKGQATLSVHKQNKRLHLKSRNAIRTKMSLVSLILYHKINKYYVKHTKA